MRLNTIGHSTAELPALLNLLREKGIGVVVDVRSKPVSRMQHFNQGPLQAAIEHAGIRYRFLGDRLGGMPRNPEIASRWKQGKLDEVILAHLRSTDEWHDGLVEVARLMKAEDEVCLLCSEGNPDECHRKAIALDMIELFPAVEIRHLSVNRPAPTEIGVQEVLL